MSVHQPPFPPGQSQCEQGLLELGRSPASENFYLDYCYSGKSWDPAPDTKCAMCSIYATCFEDYNMIHDSKALEK